MYRERMNSYYPPTIRSISDFQGIIDSEYPEFEQLQVALENVISNAYLSTMDEFRIAQWEKVLGIKPLSDSTLEDRRETIMARIRGQGKLNTEMINIIVKTFTGGTAESHIKDNVLYVKITPPPENKSYRFENVEQELAKKVPAHLGFDISRNYYTWKDININNPTWNDVRSKHITWENMLLSIPLDYSKPIIIKQPENQTVPVNGAAIFTIEAVGEGDLTYRWEYSRPNDTRWSYTTMTGYNTNTLTVDATAARNGYQYRCEIKDATGAVAYTEVATLTVS